MVRNAPFRKLVLAVACALSVAGFPQTAAAQTASAVTEPDHQSIIRVAPFGDRQGMRRITIGVDKSVLVEFPYRLSDVLVSNPEVLDATVHSAQMVYLIGKDLGDANVILMADTGQKFVIEVSISRDLTALTDMFARLLPGSNIKAELAGDNVVLSGTALTPVDANRAGDLAARFTKVKDKVVNLVKTSSKEQVHLRVKVAEMSRDAIRRLGVDIPGAALNSGDFSFAKVIKNALPITGPLVAEAAASGTQAVPRVSAGSAFEAGWQNGQQSVNTLIQALERRGLIKTLAEPNLTAVSGETAKFLAGGEFPIPVAQDDNKISVTFKQFGVSLTFKPVVMTPGHISLQVAAEVSELSTEGAVQLTGTSLPGLKIRRAETTLELPSGGTLAMAGLLSDDVRQSVEGVPGLKDLPMLGALFRSNDFRRRETELVILVTPYLATHTSRQELATPHDGFAPESELQRLIWGRLNRLYGNGQAPAGRYHGDYGFIIEYPDLSAAKG